MRLSCCDGMQVRETKSFVLVWVLNDFKLHFLVLLEHATYESTENIFVPENIFDDPLQNWVRVQGSCEK